MYFSRCATNKAIDAGLSNKKGQELHSFRCTVHPLETFARQCRTTLGDYEKQHITAGSDGGTSGPRLFARPGESPTHCLIRKAGGLFYNEQTGVQELLTTHLKTLYPVETHRRTHLYERFVGNRLNILFINAQTLLFYKDGITSFFCTHTPTNDLQRSVLATLKGGTCDVPLQALGLMCKLVTGPWMRFMEGDDTTLEMNPAFSGALAKLGRKPRTSSC